VAVDTGRKVSSSSDEVLVEASEGECREDPTYPPGALVGSYWVEDVIGEGGTACVYKAKHARLGRRVALKALQNKYSAKPEMVERFFAEARAANQINHDNVVQVTDFIEDKQSHTYYFVMELLEGFDLRELIELEGALPPERAVHIALQIVDALEAAHEAHIIHRDLKPENVYLVESERHDDFVKILDFGVAKVVQDSEEWLKLLNRSTFQTSPGALIGTPAYMSPEQLSGKELDARTDIYSFGLLLYEMVTGWPPFTGDSFADIVVAHKKETPKPPTSMMQNPDDLPYAIEELILRCLEKEPAKRPASMREIWEELRTIAAAKGWRTEWAPAHPFKEGESADSTTLRLHREDLVEATKRGSQEITLEGLRPDLVAASARGSSVPPAAPEDDGRVEELEEELLPRRGPPLWAVLLGVILLAGAAAGAAVILLREETGGESDDLVEAAARPESVQVSFESAPPGAEVFREGGAEPMGRTPFTAKLARSVAPTTFEFRKEGYGRARKTIRLSRDLEVSAALSPSREEPPEEPTTVAEEALEEAGPAEIDPPEERRSRRRDRDRRSKRQKQTDQVDRAEPAGRDLNVLVDPYGS
jgi:serine/threonine-protein kinase